MSVPAATVLARAPKLFAAAALPIVALWGLSAIPRKRTPEELREEHKEKERRARLLKEMCESLANSFLGKEDGLENVEKESQIEWEDIRRRCMEVAVTNAEAPELEDGLEWSAKVLIQQLRLTYEKTTAQDDVRYADCKKLDHLWYCEEELRELTRLVKKYSVPADLQTDLKQIAKKCYWVSRMNMLKNMRKAANMILLAKRSLPWLIADMIVAGYMTYWASMKIHYRAQLLSALVSTSSVRSPQFQMAVKSHAVVELFVAVLRTLNQQLSVRSQDLVARDIQGKLYAAIFAKDEHWWSTQTDGGGWALIQLVFFLPKELKEFMRIPRELINAAVQIVTQSRLVREKSSPMLYVLLALHWANFFGQMGLRWLKQRAGRRLTAKLVVSPKTVCPQHSHHAVVSLRPLLPTGALSGEVHLGPRSAAGICAHVSELRARREGAQRHRVLPGDGQPADGALGHHGPNLLADAERPASLPERYRRLHFCWRRAGVWRSD